jgi:hypothetical protein
MSAFYVTLSMSPRDARMAAVGLTLMGDQAISTDAEYATRCYALAQLFTANVMACEQEAARMDAQISVQNRRRA